MKDTWKFLTANSMFSAARMGIGSTAVAYLLSKGITLSEIAFVKLVQGLIIILAEIPTGLFADALGRRLSCVFACLCGIGSFVCYYCGGSLLLFSLAEILNALTISFWSGAFEALTVDHFKSKNSDRTFLGLLFTRMSLWASVGTMFGGLLGGMLAGVNGPSSMRYAFLFSILLMILTVLFFIFIVPESKRTSQPFDELQMQSRYSKLISDLRLTFKQGLARKEVRIFLYLQLILQFMLQPVFHYWQPYFQNFGRVFTPTILGYIFAAYVGSHILFSIMTAGLIRHGQSVPKLVTGLGIIAGVCFGILPVVRSGVLAVLFFVVAQGSSNSLRNLIASSINPILPSEVRATILSSISLFSRFGMLGCLVMIGYLLKTIPIAEIYLISAFSAFLFLPMTVVWWKAILPKVYIAPARRS